MSLVVRNLTKIYGLQKAVDNISFSVAQGEIVGFLGPNGAGKSTTMKIITTYLSANAGEVRINDQNINDKILEVRKIIGYLPEHNPLYLEMYVREYLSFVGKIYGLTGKILDHRINEMISLCGLAGEQHKRIESLSKGYRQRVGLAQALIHDPQILILDEPTSGLDPNQIIEIRKLIKQISEKKTVLFSTHIMQEVKALCSRVIIIHKGQIVADSKLEDLMKNKNAMSLFIEFDVHVETDVLRKMTHVKKVEQLNGNQFRISGDDKVDLRPIVFAFAKEKNMALLELRVEESSLEEVFRELTLQPKDEILL